MNPIVETNLPGVKLLNRGKVRDVYAIGEDKLLIVATDRISAFDYVLGTGIPDKGKVLTQTSLFWFERFHAAGLVENHLISADVTKFPAPLPQFAEQLEGRSMLVHRAKMVDVECVARGYISGSGWKDYQKTGAICGIPLPSGMKESDRLPEPIFTPSTKAQTGHDENISFEQAAASVGAELAGKLRSLTLALYSHAAEYALTRGIIIADTKFEFGFINGTLSLCDEALTPDSSRFWPQGGYKPGGAQPSFDKQFVRDYLEKIRWNKQPPVPSLPDEVVSGTREKYLEAYRLLTGKRL
jgi:phosphoribosylaminoimidazole-succinocarboxamide synthase